MTQQVELTCPRCKALLEAYVNGDNSVQSVEVAYR